MFQGHSSSIPNCPTSKGNNRSFACVDEKSRFFEAFETVDALDALDDDLKFCAIYVTDPSTIGRLMSNNQEAENIH
jgi:hypothetical protein